MFSGFFQKKKLDLHCFQFWNQYYIIDNIHIVIINFSKLKSETWEKSVSNYIFEKNRNRNQNFLVESASRLESLDILVATSQK